MNVVSAIKGTVD